MPETFTGSETVTLDEAIAVINSLLALDRMAISRLLMTRHPVNAGVAGHPTIQIFRQGQAVSVGALGILNALFGKIADGRGGITMIPGDGGSGGIARVERTRRSATPVADAVFASQDAPGSNPGPRTPETTGVVPRRERRVSGR